MTRFVVLEPADVEAPSERAVFVRDRLSGWAVLLPAIWLWRYALWLEGVVALALTIAFILTGNQLGAPLLGFGLVALLGLLVALEGPALRIAALQRRGYRETAAFEAADGAEAELVYFAANSAPAAPSADAALAIQGQPSFTPASPANAPLLRRQPPATLLDFGR
ncbi:DUF2628 domain-containing protein [Mangrovicella endophytica]|uniref:DUF2628 domain-containing protein n=1 Tax=Mangrovicella endophytica TaxID=2066697 RepID=UPI0013000711|nr:DUF2628 domain-containing protein [Mangrovicella endophytica]